MQRDLVLLTEILDVGDRTIALPDGRDAAAREP